MSNTVPTGPAFDLSKTTDSIPDAVRAALLKTLPEQYTPQLAADIANAVLAQLTAEQSSSGTALTEAQLTLARDDAGGWDATTPIETATRDIDADMPVDGPFLAAQIVVTGWSYDENRRQVDGRFTRVWLHYGASTGELTPAKARQVAAEIRDFANRLEALCDRADEVAADDYEKPSLQEMCRGDYEAAEERRRLQDRRDDANLGAYRAAADDADRFFRRHFPKVAAFLADEREAGQ